MVSWKKKSESLIKYYIKVTCAFKWARKLPRKTVTYESAKCVSCNTRKCTHNRFVSDLLRRALKCRFYATGPWPLNWSKAGADLVLLQTFLLFMYKSWYSYAYKPVNMIIYIWKTRRFVTKQGHGQPCFYSKAGVLSTQKWPIERKLFGP